MSGRTAYFTFLSMKQSIKLLTIIGARPQIIKAAAFSRAVMERDGGNVIERILHTGQHYDSNMSQVFFDELGIPLPDYNLKTGSGQQGEQTAKMIAGIEGVLLSEKFDGMVLYGDTNSTIAGAIAGAKLHVPVFHIEAGLRSYNMAMPEEINRIICDQCSSILFAPTETAVQNLKLEGFQNTGFRFKNGKTRKIINSGDVMYDNVVYFAKLANEKSRVLESHDLVPGHYILATIHRDNNTDNPDRLIAIFSALLQIAEEQEMMIVLPLHPRTAKRLKSNRHEVLFNAIRQSAKIMIIPPASFLDMLLLEKNAAIVMTDSGGVQKESFFFEKPCVIFRPETEWTEIVETGAGILADANFDRIIEAFKNLLRRQVAFPKLFGEGNASKFILNKIVDYLS